ncbi:hypothetical protein Q7P37_007561 [Cladosporium fusiforme]
MSQQPRERRRGGGGPIGGLIKLVGTGVGAAVEYHGHRKERKAARDSAQASPEETPVIAGPSSRPDAAQQRSISNDLPPSYAQSTGDSSAHDRQLATGPPANDEKKSLRRESSSSSDSDYLYEEDEEAWELDEVAASNEPPSYEDATNDDADALVRDVLAARSAADPNKPVGKLPLPVILPQRRPRIKSRGFVRAYSPVLEDVGIDQQTFLRFLKNFHTSSQANPCFTAVIVAASIAGLVPDPIVMAVTTSVQVVASVGQEIDSRRKTNNFLDRMNETLFKPAGCYAFIMKYKSDEEVNRSGAGSLLSKFGIGAEKVDFSTTKAIAKYDLSSSASGTTGLSAKMQKVRLTSGETRGSMKMLEAAPLIYPGVDEVVYSGKDGQETFKDKAKDAQKFLAGYVDRRKQMSYARDDPSSSLVVPESQRQNQSKWSDPNNPMFTGGLVGLVSGGHIDMGARREAKRERRYERREAKHERKDERRERRFEKRYGSRSGGDYYESSDAFYGSVSSNPPAPHAPYGGSEQDPDYSNRAYHGRQPRSEGRRRGGSKGGPIGAIRKVMQEDVLYLMIVPLPSEAELEEAREMLALEKARK